jgi:hypothetical protein
MKLRRVVIGPVKLDKLPKGKARRVSVEELAELRKFVASAQEKIEKARIRAAAKPGTLETGDGKEDARGLEKGNQKSEVRGQKATNRRQERRDRKTKI